MKMTSVNKVQFASLNDKQYCCFDGITLLPYGQSLVLELRKKRKDLLKLKVSLKKNKIMFYEKN